MSRFAGYPRRFRRASGSFGRVRPNWRALAVDVFHVRAVLVYAALLIVWRTLTILHDGGTAREAGIVAAWLLLLPVGATRS